MTASHSIVSPVFTTLASNVALLPLDDIDTDQIIPARYLKTTEKAGLAPNLFADWRYHADGAPKLDFALLLPEAEGAKILLVGNNFGCGSSREHAPWALTAWGFRAVIALSFADIFRSNALKNGLLPVVLEPEAHARVVALRAARPSTELAIDLFTQRVTLPDGESFGFPIDPFAKRCLVQGVDELGYILSFEHEIAEHEARA
jgi:3-isopropylmalate/(R)-2-methylmalate dehydratase small subunit